MRRKKMGGGEGGACMRVRRGGLHTVAARSRVNPGDPVRARATLLLGSGCGAHFHIFFLFPPRAIFTFPLLPPRACVRACVSDAQTHGARRVKTDKTLWHIFGPMSAGEPVFLPQDVRRNPTNRADCGAPDPAFVWATHRPGEKPICLL